MYTNAIRLFSSPLSSFLSSTSFFSSSTPRQNDVRSHQAAIGDHDSGIGRGGVRVAGGLSAGSVQPRIGAAPARGRKTSYDDGALSPYKNDGGRRGGGVGQVQQGQGHQGHQGLQVKQRMILQHGQGQGQGQGHYRRASLSHGHGAHAATWAGSSGGRDGGGAAPQGAGGGGRRQHATRVNHGHNQRQSEGNPLLEAMSRPRNGSDFATSNGQVGSAAKYRSWE